MITNSRIVDYLNKSSHLFPSYIFSQLKDTHTLNLISRIINQSDKEIAEGVVVFLGAVKYLMPGKDAFSVLEEKDSFQEFISNHAETLVDLSIRNKVQGNLPERAFPLLEIINDKINSTSIAMIELGASFGLIGRCLLSPFRMIENKDRYFSQCQKIPKNFRGIDYYLGIDLDPPDKEWLLACAWWSPMEKRLRNLIHDLVFDPRFHLIKANALGFSQMEPVRELLKKTEKVVVLTSFMLYQLEQKKQKKLTEEILKFTDDTGAYWLNQYVDISGSSSIEEYYISLNGERLIRLPDDKCFTWEWMVSKLNS